MDHSKDLEDVTTTYTDNLEKTKTSDLISAGGIFLDIEGREISVKTAKDGHVSVSSSVVSLLLSKKTILVPQPSDDPNDPVNWSWTKKHLLLFTVAWGALCADFTSAGGIPCIFLQAADWHMDPNKVNYANNLNVLMM